MGSACSFIFMQIKVIFIRKVLHLDSLWNRGTRELWNGLLKKKKKKTFYRLLYYPDHFLKLTTKIIQHSCSCVSFIIHDLFKFNYLSKEYPSKKGYFFIISYTVFFCSVVHSTKWRVIEGTGSTVTAQSMRYCSVHVISRNWQILLRVSTGFLTISMLGTSRKLSGKAFLALLLPLAKLK